MGIEFVLGILALVVGGFAYWKRGTQAATEAATAAAKTTVEMLDKQLELANTRIDKLEQENKQLREDMAVLQGLVTQATPVKELTDWLKEIVERGQATREQEHMENVTYLTRIEGTLSRVEREVRCRNDSHDH